MRSVVLLLLIAVAFGAAATWQSRKVAALRSQRERAAALQDGRLAETTSGEVRAGFAVVTIGRPSGVSTLDPRASAELGATPPPTSDGAPWSAADEVDEWSADFELVVEAGQTLSGLAAAHYGAASEELLLALARYNELAGPDELNVGQRLRLPPLDVLLRW